MNDVRDQVTTIFREVFDQPTLELRDDLTGKDVDGWDSLAHINLIVALERNLNIRFAIAEASKMKEPGQNVGSLLRLIAKKLSSQTKR
jgi:acyl carrier protein